MYCEQKQDVSNKVMRRRSVIASTGQVMVREDEDGEEDEDEGEDEGWWSGGEGWMDGWWMVMVMVDGT
jgi:hypothetical protein